MMDIRIIQVRGHYDVYIDGEYYCSADTYGEAAVEAEQWLEKRR